MDLKEQFEGLLFIEKKLGYESMQINDFDVWPFVKNKIYGEMVTDKSVAQTALFIPQVQAMDLDRNPLHATKTYDSLIINFPRCEINDKGIIFDPKTDKLRNYFIENDHSFCELYINLDLQVRRPVGDNIYFADEMKFLNRLRDMPVEKRNYDVKEFSKVVSERCNIDFDMKKYEAEFSARSFYAVNYLKATFKKLKLKNIFVNANSARPDVMLAAKDLGIPVYDLQYAAYFPCHVGYDHAGLPYKFSPEGLLLWGEYWKNRPYYSSSIIKQHVIGRDVLNYDYKIPNKLVVVSQNLFTHHFIEKTIEIAEKNPEYEIYFKSHPNENLNPIVFDEYKNIKFSQKSLEEELKDASYAVGMYSTGVYSAIELKCKTYILKHDRNVYMEDLVDSGQAKYYDEDKTIIDQECPCFDIEMVSSEPDFSISDLLAKLDENYDFPDYDMFIDKYNDYMNRTNEKADGLFCLKGIDAFFDSLEDEKIMDIIIPAHNASSTIIETFNSIKHLRCFKNVNIYMVNDGSKDDTLEHMNKISARHTNVYVFSNDVASGNCAAPRNIAIENSNSKYITFIDADDVYFGNTLDKMLFLMEQKNADFIKAGAIMNVNSILGVTSVQNRVIKEDVWSNIKVGNSFAWTHIYKREVMQKANLRFIEKRFEDYNFNLKYYHLSKKAIFLNDFNVVYNKQEGSISTSKMSDKSLCDLLDVHFDSAEYMISNGFDTPAIKDFANRIVGMYLVVNYLDHTLSSFSNEAEEKYDRLATLLSPYFMTSFSYSGEGLYSHARKLLSNAVKVGYLGGEVADGTLAITFVPISMKKDLVEHFDIKINDTTVNFPDTRVFINLEGIDKKHSFRISSFENIASIKYFYPRKFVFNNSSYFVSTDKKHVFVERIDGLFGLIYSVYFKLRYSKKSIDIRSRIKRKIRTLLNK